MSVIYVGVGEFAVSNKPGDTIKTMALGSCVGVIILSQELRAAGLLHVALPDSTINRERSEKRPGMFADTGIEALVSDMVKIGYTGNGNLMVKLVGGAAIMDPNNTFNIGKRNLLAVKKALWKHKLGAITEDVEGTISRVTQFGAFVNLEPGIEALLHASQLSDGAPVDPAQLLYEGQTIAARIISIEPHRQRLGLSIRDVENGFDRPDAEIEPSVSAADTVESDLVEPLVAEEN